jgi:cytochrome c-type biogenesis protein CcmH/NrfG
MLAIAILLVLLAGGVAGYMMARPFDQLPLFSSTPTVSSEPSSTSSGRDPVMEAGAAFMARVTEYKQRLEKNPNDLEALIFLGNANYDITRFDQARTYYERALAIDPTNLRVRTDLATSYYSIGLVDKALDEMRTVLKQEPSHEAALYNLGLVLLNDKKDKKGAIEAWETLLQHHPDSPRASVLRQKLDELKTRG